MTKEQNATVIINTQQDTIEEFTRDDALDAIKPTALILLAIIILFLVGRRQRELNRRKERQIEKLLRPRNRG